MLGVGAPVVSGLRVVVGGFAAVAPFAERAEIAQIVGAAILQGENVISVPPVPRAKRPSALGALAFVVREYLGSFLRRKTAAWLVVEWISAAHLIPPLYAGTGRRRWPMNPRATPLPNEARSRVIMPPSRVSLSAAACSAPG
jgi:hypothetical protein